jgi:UPF0755 protein
VIAKVFRLLFILAFMVACLGAYAAYMAVSDGPLGKRTIVQVPDGGPVAVAERLADSGVVGSRLLTVLGLATMRYGFKRRPRAGEYEFDPHVSLLDVLRKLKDGKRVFYKLSVPEGFTVWQVVERLKANEVLEGELESVPQEGEVLPDTYVFYRGRTRQSLIDQMVSAQDRLMEELWPERAPDLPFSTQEEALVLASMVEKETGKPDERERVAAVFVNRLRKGMRLQSDPTVIYGITEGQGGLDRPLTRDDLRQHTEYNTYRISGLPPKPIANPGRASIKAVLNPMVTDEYYFVADGTGGHAFAKTLAEHNANVRKWRAWLADQREEEAAEEQASAENADVNAEATETGQGIAEVATNGAEKQASLNVSDEPADAARVVTVAGRSVPIPRPKPEVGQ